MAHVSDPASRQRIWAAEGHSCKNARETAREIGGGDTAAIFHHLDVTSEEDWKGAIGAAVARWGGLDILVNNAGLFLGKGIEEASLDEWHRLSRSGLHQTAFSAFRNQAGLSTLV